MTVRTNTFSVRLPISGTRGLWEGMRARARHSYHAMLHWARRSQERAEQAPGRWTLVGLTIAVVLIFLANLGRIIRWQHEKRLRAHPERSPGLAAAMWYERMARSLARRGLKKSAAQTPQEFVRRIDDARLRNAGRTLY